MPGMAPDSHMPSAKRSSRKDVTPRVNAKHVAQMPHARVMQDNQVGPPRRSSSMLLGTCTG